jgi:hypothetical protein
MLPQHVIFALFTACAAVPLNINLGAYSPALVVGDGEISLGSTEKASELMSTLASGAATNEQGQGQQQGQQENQQNQQQQQQQEGVQQEGRALAEENAAKRAPNVRTIDHLGKRAPEPVAAPVPEPEAVAAAVGGAMEWIKRDLQGFNAALSYAREALKDTPKIDLGTGEGGSGVGITVNAGSNVNKESAANGAKPSGQAAGRKAKREEVVTEESETPKMTLVAITEV